MPAKKKPVIPLSGLPEPPLAVPASTSASGSSTSTSAAPSTTTASTDASAVPTAPPDVTIPVPPAGFVPVNFKLYRGSFPRLGQIVAAPGAIVELESSTSYAMVFGTVVPPASQLASELTVATQWTALRIRIEAYLEYVRSNEAITWKTGLSDLDKLGQSFDLVAAQNPSLLAGFPELSKLLDVPKVIAKAAAATRARNTKAAKVAKGSSVTSAATPATPAAAATGGAAK